MSLQKEFINLLTLTQSEIYSYLKELLTGYGYEVQDTGYTLYAPSQQDNQVCLVAHLDTINTKKKSYTSSYNYQYTTYSDTTTEADRTPTPEDIIYTDKYILLSPEANYDIDCLGADDRVGVKTILDILGEGLRPHILFTTDEEVGCVGSRRAVEENRLEGLSEASMLIQIDRGVHSGYWNEMVTYGFDSSTQPEIFNKLGETYELTTGSYTDVAVLGPYANKPIVNVSASYQNEHTREEFINLEAYKVNTAGLIDFVKWAQEQDTTGWEYKEKPKPKVKSVTGRIYRPIPKKGEPRVSLYDLNQEDIGLSGYASAEKYITEMCKMGYKYYNPVNTFERYVTEGHDEELMLEYLDYAYTEGYYFTTMLELYSILEGKVYYSDSEVQKKKRLADLLVFLYVHQNQL